MKDILKFTFIIGVFITIYLLGDSMIQWIIPNHETSLNSSLLLTYGGIIGYILFIVFVAMLQQDGYLKLKEVKPKTSKVIHQIYYVTAVLFALYAFLGFQLQNAILMALGFMFITAALDLVRDKILSENNGKALHPKKII